MPKRHIMPTVAIAAAVVLAYEYYRQHGAATGSPFKAGR